MFSCRKLKDRIEDIRGGKLDNQLPAMWDEIKLWVMVLDVADKL